MFSFTAQSQQNERNNNMTSQCDNHANETPMVTQNVVYNFSVDITSPISMNLI